MVEVEITGCVITAHYGTLSEGDILRTDEAFAKHLVDDCKAATYRNAPVVEQEEQKPEVDAEPAKAKSGRKPK